MAKLRFYLSWITASVVMFTAFYCWHGLFLNDFSRLKYPKEIFFIGAAAAYLIIGLVITLGFAYVAKKAYEVPSLKWVQKKPFYKGLVTGSVLGVCFFLITMVLGVSFSTEYTLQNLVLDFSWQVIEQTLGGIFIGWVYIYTYDPMEFVEQEIKRDLKRSL